MADLDLMRDRLRMVRRQALAEWDGRAAERETNKETVRRDGVGAADSQPRQQLFDARQSALATARRLHREGRLPLGIERRLGATLDLDIFAPSEAARIAGRPVARIVRGFRPGMVPEGLASGFLVADNLLLTNWHVFPDGAEARGLGANFGHEDTQAGLAAGVVFQLDPEAFFLADERLDYALVGVAAVATDRSTRLVDVGTVRLIEATPKALIGQPIHIIQHPEGGPKRYAFRGDTRLVDITADGFLHYETDTGEGSSGSPAFSANWELVALHRAAIPARRDGRVLARDGVTFWTEEMGDAEVKWIANVGARVSAIVDSLRGQRRHAGAAAAAVIDRLLATTEDPVEDVKQAIPDAAPVAGAQMESRMTAKGQSPLIAFTFSGPVTMNFAVAAAPAMVAEAAAPLSAEAAGAAAPEKAIRFDRDYGDTNRTGFDTDFLEASGGLQVPLPTVAHQRRAEMLARADGTPWILHYHHFSLEMNLTRRMQMWSAVNVDYDPDRKTKREGGRKGFGTDKWIADPRIPALAQIFDAEFYKPAGNIDRGHVVRREDNAWGESETEIEFANSDTFHWTNCTPQHEAFNQANPGRNDATYRGRSGIWGAFEEHVQAQLLKQRSRACILAGPVLDNDNDPSADFGSGDIQYPLLFWKVVCLPAARDDGAPGLEVHGFVLSQKAVVREFGIEAFDPGRFASFGLPLEAITELTGVVFDSTLHVADAFQHLDQAERDQRLRRLRR
ncbi:DNA/RNA non-specific endonuclease [Roseomonas sp. CECT 9278]|uniref:DNA/RNA non-specific endonuclease n=1 Tax=Roseomonas sp. CECT 9278 TaxID=2845823 RepID=UPI001E50456D|nr:DNA/RNA non-specific endonuclease [Roseomonas sp. CECT 9278]CAH0254388.1 hypothetical protein ROS9278_03231 [Roseomonas sp. CECT 9278]